jgi:hypothetical protein
LTTAEVQAVLQRLADRGLVEQPAGGRWQITSAGEDALYDWNPWRFLVEEVVAASRLTVERPRWLTSSDRDPILAVGRFLTMTNTFAYVRDAFEVENDGRRGWRVCDGLLGDEGPHAMHVDIDVTIGDVLVRRSPPPGQPRPQPRLLG